MAIISYNSIHNKIEKWKKTQQGKNKIQAAQRKHISSYEGESDRIVHILLDIIQDHLPDSIKSNIQLELSDISNPKYIDATNKFKIDITFPQEMLHRDSLYPQQYPQGVDNIIALLNNGINAKAHVYGWWNTAHANVVSVKDRDALHFIQDAIIEFNNQYGNTYKCFAIIDNKYE